MKEVKLSRATFSTSPLPRHAAANRIDNIKNFSNNDSMEVGVDRSLLT